MRDLPEAPVAYRPRHIDALDGVRGLAVLIVFSFHYAGGTHASFTPLRLFGLANKGGWSGVVLFFVLSGFLITGILWDSFEDPHWWRKFFARRSLRIFPLYYLALLLLLVGAFFTHHGAAALRSIWVPGLVPAGFPTLRPRGRQPPRAFRDLSPLVHRRRRAVLPLLALAALPPRAPPHARRTLPREEPLPPALRRLVRLSHRRLEHPAPADLYVHHIVTQAGALVLGGWLALAFRGPEWPSVLRLAPAIALFGLAGFVFAGLRAHNFGTESALMMTSGLPSVSLFYFGLIALTLRQGWIARLFSIGWLRRLGNISYGVYVFHMFFLGQYATLEQHLVGHRSLMVRNVVLLVIAVCGTLVAALLSWNLFEKPILRLKKYFVPEI